MGKQYIKLGIIAAVASAATIAIARKSAGGSVTPQASDLKVVLPAAAVGVAAGIIVAKFVLKHV